MIFVTVGTHEQPFNRLIKKVDELKREGLIKDDIFMQIGYSTYEPEYCKWEKVISYQEMEQYMEKSDKIITHGGPATFMGVLAKGERPIVVPRLAEFGEHVNNHQLEFAQKVVSRGYPIILVSTLENNLLLRALQGNTLIDTDLSNNLRFISEFKKEIKEVL